MDRNELETTPPRRHLAEAPSFRAPLLWLGISGVTWVALIGSVYWFLD